MTEPKPEAPGNVRREGVLAGHSKVGRRYRPPFLSVPGAIVNDWVRDDLPDLLWPVILVALHGDESAALFRHVQQRVIGALRGEEMERAQVTFDGRLSSVEAVTDELRAPIREALLAHELRESWIPRELRAVLALYPGAPGGWLIEPDLGEWERTDAIEFLRDAMVAVVADSHKNALVKTPPTGWLLLLGKLEMPTDVVNLLRDYPTNPSSHPAADAFIRSAFLAHRVAGVAGLRDGGELLGRSRAEPPALSELAVAWARRFWTANWKKVPCLLEADEDAVDTADLMARAEAAYAALDDIYQRFLEAALDRDLAVDLHTPARHEVLTGLVARLFGITSATLARPESWVGDMACVAMRALAETEIVTAWMLAAGGEEVFSAYQAYGIGRRKLQRLHLRERLEQLGDQAPAELREVEQLYAERTGGDLQEAFQEVSVESTFAGISLRQMAEEVGALGRYRAGFQLSSGVLHGEWWAIEDYCVARCWEPLHRFHQVPAPGVKVDPTLDFGDFLVARFEEYTELVMPALVADQGSQPNSQDIS